MRENGRRRGSLGPSSRAKRAPFQTSLGKKKFFPFFSPTPVFLLLSFLCTRSNSFEISRNLCPTFIFRVILLYLNGETSLKSPVIGNFHGRQFLQMFPFTCSRRFPLEKERGKQKFHFRSFRIHSGNTTYKGKLRGGCAFEWRSKFEFPTFCHFHCSIERGLVEIAKSSV